MAKKKKLKSQFSKPIDNTEKRPVSLEGKTSLTESHGTCIRCCSQPRWLDSPYCFDCYMAKTAPKPRKITYSKDTGDRNNDYNDIISSNLSRKSAETGKQNVIKSDSFSSNSNVDSKIYLTQDEISKLTLSMFNGSCTFYERVYFKRYLKVYDDQGAKKEVVVWLDKRRNRVYASIDDNAGYVGEIRRVFKKKTGVTADKKTAKEKIKKSNLKNSMKFSNGKELRFSKTGDFITVFYQDDYEKFQCNIHINRFLEMIKER